MVAKLARPKTSDDRGRPILKRLGVTDNPSVGSLRTQTSYIRTSGSLRSNRISMTALWEIESGPTLPLMQLIGTRASAFRHGITLAKMRRFEESNILAMWFFLPHGQRDRDPFVVHSRPACLRLGNRRWSYRPFD